MHLSFSSLKLSAPILHALTESGYETPTPIQAQAIPAALAGRDLLGCAQTGTGKTAAFALPIIQRLAAPAGKPVQRAARLPRALVLSPTRELAVQIAESFATYGSRSGITATTVYGGVSQMHQVRALQRGVDVVVATPGRLMDLMEQRVINLSAIETLVLDEADRMLDMGFIAPIRRIAAAVPVTRQTLLFSATMPREIVKLAESLLRDPVRVAVSTAPSAAPKIEQSVHMVSRQDKPTLLVQLLADPTVERALVFVRTKHGADKICRRLCQSGIVAEAIHGNRNQNQRQRSLDAFRSGRAPVLVATDVAARGIDVDGITHVFNLDLPMEAEAYVHRIGRTGRAGATGLAVAFCDADERGMLRQIEKLIGKPIERAKPVVLAARAAGAPAEVHAGSGAHTRPHGAGTRGAVARKAHPFAAAAHGSSHGAHSQSGGSRVGTSHAGAKHPAAKGGAGRGGARRHRTLAGGRTPR